MNQVQEEQLQKYSKLTGHDFDYLMQGASQYGIDKILNVIVPEALSAGRKIVWKDDPVDGESVGRVRYELQPV